MTIPSVLEHHQKTVVVTSLKKFYSSMQDAIKLSEVENGDMTKDWLSSCTGINGCFENWFETYIRRYLNLTSVEYDDSYGYVTFADGSGFVAYAKSGIVHFFYCIDYSKCGIEKYDGRNSFLFSVDTLNSKFQFLTSSSDYHSKTRSELLERCSKGDNDSIGTSSLDKRHACARLIEYDGWQIKSDYPWHQTMVSKS